MFDVGTDNAALLTDPLYTGLLQPRVRGEAYLWLVEELVTAVQQEFPHALLQFEDFATANAISLLARFRERACTFNDDIQGTAAVTLAGLISAGRVASSPTRRSCSTAPGGGDGDRRSDRPARVREASRRMRRESASGSWTRRPGRRRRPDLEPHKQRYAHAHPRVTDLAAAAEAVRPTAIIGCQPGAGVLGPVIRAMAHIASGPSCSLSNPTAGPVHGEQAHCWSNGRACSPAGASLKSAGRRRFEPRQGNNLHLPGVGLG
jgi:malate dehydrogenase (oxaloacetate-decarboxylating)(NADP+)